MELLEKYLQAVKFWLPSSQQNDIIAELRDDIRSEAEERESVLGRTLNESEWETLLKQRGRPMLVAEKYLPQRWLIGPVLFPAYWFVLRLALLCYLAPLVAVWIGLLAFNPGYRARHLEFAMIGDIWFLLYHAMVSVMVITIIFAALDRGKDKAWLTRDWSPRKLPRVKNNQRILRVNSGFELILGLIFGFWWLKILWTLGLFDAGGIKITISPGWHKFFWMFLPLWILSSGFSILNLIRPYWTRARRGMRATLNVLTAVVLFLVARSSMSMIVQGPAISGGKAQVISWGVNFSLMLGFAIAVLICLINAGIEVWRVLRFDSTPAQLNHSVAI